MFQPWLASPARKLAARSRRTVRRAGSRITISSDSNAAVAIASGGAVEKMLIIFDRVANFHQFTSPEVLDLVNQVRGKLKGKTYEDLNANGGDNKLTASVKGIMGELKALVEQQWELQKSRVDRSIMI